MTTAKTSPDLLKMFRTDWENVDFKDLVIKLDAELKIKNRKNNDFYVPFNSLEKVDYVIIAYHENIAIGCGAIKKYGVGVVEIKRMFVLPRFRNKGIGLKMLRELEKWALEMSYTKSILETGKNFPAAMTLYLKAGILLNPIILPMSTQKIAYA